MVAQQRRATTPERRRSGPRQEVRPARKKGGGFPVGKWLLALSLGGSFGAYQYLKQEDPPGIERVQPQLFRGKLNAEQKLRFAYIEKAIERAKVCSLYAWPVLETLNEASRLTRTPAKFLLSTMVVESRGDCSAIPWVYDKEQKVFIPASSAYGPVQMLEGTRREVSKKILNDPNIRKLTFLPTELTAPFLDDESVKRNVENYLNSTKSINENLGLNFVFAGEYYQQLLKHYKNLRVGFSEELKVVIDQVKSLDEKVDRIDGRLVRVECSLSNLEIDVKEIKNIIPNYVENKHFNKLEKRVAVLEK